MFVISAVPVFPFSIWEKTIEKPIRINYIENPTCLGDKIKNKRLSLNLTQEETATKIGVARNCIIDWENKNTDPAIEFYPAIIHFLGYTPFEFDTSCIGGKIKKYRFLNGLSLDNLAARLNLGSATIFRLENGKGIPNKKTNNALRAIIKNI